ncbi:glycosyltransferase [Flavobacterium sp.]|uniref:glycosyltransferase family 2 protein n=1 Tax=Flavobacterium sp. TaxID=239 RepID=UPI002622FD56|nr:glycosyltransferase [Flavobacterium sp.]
MSPLISVVVPVYNVSKYLKQCLDSILNQTYTSLEIILVNDGSTDDSLNICYNYQKSDSRIRVIDQKNQGVSVSRNTGLCYITGDYLMFVDGDDWLKLDTIENVFQSLSSYDLVCFSFIKEYPTSKVVRDLLLNGSYDADFFQRRLTGLINEELSDPSHFETFATVWGKIFKSSIIKEHSIVFKKMSEIGAWEDGYFNWDYLNYCKSVFIINQPFYHYRKFNSDSITSNHKSGMLQKTNYLFDLIEADLIDKNKGVEFQKAFNNRIVLSVIGLGLNEIYKNDSLFNKYRNIKNILFSPVFDQAYKNLSLKYFPTHWKLFFFFAKNKLVYPLIFMLYAIKKIIKK